MTVASEACYAELSWTGVETLFTAGFLALDAAHIKASYRDAGNVVTVLTAGVHLTISKAGDANEAGAITAVPVAMPAAPGTLLLERITPAVQAVDFENLNGYAADVHSRLHDAAAMRAAELKRRTLVLEVAAASTIAANVSLLANSATAARSDRLLADADAVATAEDAEDTAADAVSTAADRVATAADRAATHADKLAADADAAAASTPSQQYVALAGTSLTLNAANAATYRGTIIRTTNASAVAITLSADMPIGFNCGVRQVGAGQVTFTAGAGASLTNVDSESKTAAQNATVLLDVDVNAGGTAAAWNLNGRTGS